MKKFLIAIAFAFAIGAVASTAKADTTADIMAQIAALQAQLSGSAMTAGYTFSADLTIGSTGADVVALQDLLISKGYLTMPAGVAKGYFGQLTKSAVAAWQASVGLPATGYFGPLSRAKVSGVGTTTTTTTTTTTPVCPTGFTCVSNTTTTTTTSGNGDEGQLDNVKTIGGTDSSVEEGEENSKVLGVQVEAQDSDMTIERVDVDFDLDAISGGSQNLNHYIDSVTLWLDGKKLDTQDVSEGDEEDNVFSFRFTGLKGKIAEDKTAKLYVSVTAVNSIKSADVGEDITVSIPNDGIRAVDEAGISDTYGSNLDDSFSVGERSEGDLSLTSDDDDDRTVSVDDQDDTSDVSLLKFELESKDQTNTINEITVKIATSSFATSSSIIDTLYLFADGEEVGSESLSAATSNLASVTFDDLNLDIEEDDTVDFEVRADIARQEDNYPNGAQITASVATADIDAEDEAGDDTDVSGGDVTGGTITLRTSGVMVAVKGTPTSSILANDADLSTDNQGKYVVEFTVNAFEDPAFVALTASRSSTTLDSGVNYTIESASTSAEFLLGSTAGTVLERVSGGTIVGNYVKINDGQSATFRLTVYFDPTFTDSYRAQLYSVNFAATNVAPTTRELAVPEEDFQTPSESVLN